MSILQCRRFAHTLLVFFMVLCDAICFSLPQEPASKLTVKAKSLFFAIKKGDVDKVKVLLKEGADPNLRDEEGWTPLNVAVLCRNKKAQKQIIAAMLGKKADPNSGTQSKRKGDMSFPNGMTPLMLASLFVDFDTAELLLKNGAKVDKVNDEGMTALMLVGIYSGKDPKAKTSVDLATLYIKNGADINHKDKSGMTPLMSAILSFNVQLTQFLLDKGADVAVKNKRGETPLLCAIQQISLLFSANESYKESGFKIVKALVEKGAGKSGDEKREALIKVRILKLKRIEALLNN